MNRILFFLQRSCILFFLLFSVISCEDSTPTLGSVQHTVLYEYIENVEKPIVRLAVYLELVSDPDRIDRIEVFSKESGYYWDIENPLSIQSMNSNTVWIGSSNLLPDSNNMLPSGEYVLSYYDLAERKEEIRFIVTQAENDEGILKDEFTNRKVAIFDEKGYILYFGNDSSLENAQTVQSKYPEAKSIRIILLDESRNSAILEPIQKLQDGE